MLVKPETRVDEKTPFWVNTWRPSFTDDESRKFWIKFHDLVINSPIAIVANGMFYRLDEEVRQTSGGYLGSGFKYLFWFKSIEDRTTFMNTVDTEFEKEMAQFPSFRAPFSKYCEFSKDSTDANQ